MYSRAYTAVEKCTDLEKQQGKNPALLYKYMHCTEQKPIILDLR